MISLLLPAAYRRENLVVVIIQNFEHYFSPLIT